MLLSQQPEKHGILLSTVLYVYSAAGLPGFCKFMPLLLCEWIFGGYAPRDSNAWQMSCAELIDRLTCAK